MEIRMGQIACSSFVLHTIVFILLGLITIRVAIRLCMQRINRDVATKKKLVLLAARTFQVIFTLDQLTMLITDLPVYFAIRKIGLIIRTTIRKYKEKQDCGSKLFAENLLLQDTMQLILQQLRLSDVVRCGAVCRSWQAMSTKITIRCRIAPELPWLMLCSHPLSTIDHNFISLTDLKDHRLLPPFSFSSYRMNKVDCVGSIDGWLIMADNAMWRPDGSFYWYSDQRSNFKIVYFFWNPISGGRVTLPSSKSTFPCRCHNRPGFYIVKIVASSAPTSTEQPCFLVSICDQGHLAFCVSTDKSWCWASMDNQDLEELHPFKDIAIMKGKLYAATWKAIANNYLVVFDIIHDDANNNNRGGYGLVKSLVLNHSPTIHAFNFPINNQSLSLAHDSASTELFMIFRDSSLASHVVDHNNLWLSTTAGLSYVTPPKTRGFRVFKLCNTVMNGGAPWVEVDDLGDRILFVSRTSNTFISINNCALNNDFGGKMIERNSIHFAFHYPCSKSPSMGYDFGVYPLTNKSIRYFTLSGSYSRSSLPTRPVWFTPNPW